MLLLRWEEENKYLLPECGASAMENKVTLRIRSAITNCLLLCYGYGHLEVISWWSRTLKDTSEIL